MAELLTSQATFALDLSGCRCVACGGLELSTAKHIDPHSVAPKAITCAACGAVFDVIYGIPYLMTLEEQDFVALLEIAAQLDFADYNLIEGVPFDQTWPRLLQACSVAPDYATYKAQLDPSYAADLDDRYDQWKMMQTLAGDIDLAGKNVLVVGAGLGFDTNLVLDRGARVTAVDLNPQTNAIGQRQTPRARWIGALGRRLPFVDAAFDYAFISASLHHVLDVSATLIEMMRVVKPGGSVITTNDSHSADITTDLEDARFWNNHTDVLRGINENTPRLKVYVDPLLDRIDQIDLDFWTHRAFGFYDEETDTRRDLLVPRKWDLLRHEKRLRETGGGVFMRITPKRQIRAPFPPPTPTIIRPSELTALIGRKREAMAKIARLAPPAFVSPDFPGPAGNTKFQVLNGWRWSEPGAAGRDAYLCGRWYMKRAPGETRLLVSARAPLAPGAADPRIEIAVDGRVRAGRVVRRGAAIRFEIAIDDLPMGVPIAVEVGLEPMSDEFEHKLVRVERLKFAQPDWLADGLRRLSGVRT